MPRKGPAPKRPLVVDPVYGSSLVTQLINKVLVDGKKSTAERIVYGALNGTREKGGDDPVAHAEKGAGSTSVPPRGIAHAVLVARPTRCPLRSSLVAQPLWRCVGW